MNNKPPLTSATIIDDNNGINLGKTDYENYNRLNISKVYKGDKLFLIFASFVFNSLK